MQSINVHTVSSVYLLLRASAVYRDSTWGPTPVSTHISKHHNCKDPYVMKKQKHSSESLGDSPTTKVCRVQSVLTVLQQI
jgi:hypothetical protein